MIKDTVEHCNATSAFSRSTLDKLALILMTMQETWAFVSAHLLFDPNKSKQLSNHLVSFIHVFTWLAACFHKHLKSVLPLLTDEQYTERETWNRNMQNEPLAVTIQREYDDCQPTTSGHYYYVSGKWKTYHLEQGRPPIALLERRTPLAGLIQDLYTLCSRHYTRLDLYPVDVFTVEGEGTIEPNPLRAVSDAVAQAISKAAKVKITPRSSPRPVLRSWIHTT